MPAQDPKDQEIEEQEDFDFDEEADADENADDTQMRINRIVKMAVAQSNKAVQQQLSAITKRVDDHDSRIANLEKVVSNVSAMVPNPNAKVKPSAQQVDSKGLDKFLDVTLGTAGRMGHAVVDTVAFVGESLVDIVTLGRARVNKG